MASKVKISINSLMPRTLNQLILSDHNPGQELFNEKEKEPILQNVFSYIVSSWSGLSLNIKTNK